MLTPSFVPCNVRHHPRHAASRAWLSREVLNLLLGLDHVKGLRRHGRDRAGRRACRKGDAEPRVSLLGVAAARQLGLDHLKARPVERGEGHVPSANCVRWGKTGCSCMLTPLLGIYTVDRINFTSKRKKLYYSIRVGERNCITQ